MTGHPDDEAFLDTLPFDSAGWLCCTRCDDPAAIGVHLARARAAAQGRGQRFTPSMPEQERL
jgi:hypothetical protein